MARLLIVAPPLQGHIRPMISLAAAASAQHEVAWVGEEPMLRTCGQSRDAKVYGVPERIALADRKGPGAGLAWAMALWRDTFHPEARHMLPYVESAVADFSPDLLIVDHVAYAGVLAANKQGLRFVTTVPSASPAADLVKQIGTVLPGFKRWLDAEQEELCRLAGVPRVEFISPDLILHFSVSELAGEGAAATRYTGLMGTGRVEDLTSFPWERLGTGRDIFVGMGTLVAGVARKFYQTVSEALADHDGTVVVSAPEGSFETVPDNFIVRPHVPQLAVLARVNAVLCHGGHNTVCEALANGLPVIVAPSGGDTPFVAERLLRSGAGVRVSFQRPDFVEIRKAVQCVLDQDEVRSAARRVQLAFHNVGGSAGAVEHINRLLGEA